MPVCLFLLNQQSATPFLTDVFRVPPELILFPLWNPPLNQNILGVLVYPKLETNQNPAETIGE